MTMFMSAPPALHASCRSSWSCCSTLQNVKRFHHFVWCDFRLCVVIWNSVITVRLLIFHILPQIL